MKLEGKLANLSTSVETVRSAQELARFRRESVCARLLSMEQQLGLPSPKIAPVCQESMHAGPLSCLTHLRCWAIDF
jgi:hypothetical protein